MEKEWCLMISKNRMKAEDFSKKEKNRTEGKRSAHKREYAQKRSKILFRHLQQKKWKFYLKSLCTQHKIQLQKHHSEMKGKN